MAMKYLTSIDLVKNEIQNAVIQVLTTPPAAPKEVRFTITARTSLSTATMERIGGLLALFIIRQALPAQSLPVLTIKVRPPLPMLSA